MVGRILSDHRSFRVGALKALATALLRRAALLLVLAALGTGEFLILILSAGTIAGPLALLRAWLPLMGALLALASLGSLPLLRPLALLSSLAAARLLGPLSLRISLALRSLALSALALVRPLPLLSALRADLALWMLLALLGSLPLLGPLTRPRALAAARLLGPMSLRISLAPAQILGGAGLRLAGRSLPGSRRLGCLGLDHIRAGLQPGKGRLGFLFRRAGNILRAGISHVL